MTETRAEWMNKMLKVMDVELEIKKTIKTTDAANALIAKWNDGNLGSSPLEMAISQEARNRVFGWGR